MELFCKIVFVEFLAVINNVIEDRQNRLIVGRAKDGISINFKVIMGVGQPIDLLLFCFAEYR